MDVAQIMSKNKWDGPLAPNTTPKRRHRRCVRVEHLEVQDALVHAVFHHQRAETLAARPVLAHQVLCRRVDG